MTRILDFRIRNSHSDQVPACAATAQAIIPFALSFADTSRNNLSGRHLVCVGAALLSACVAPAVAMAALWSAQNIRVEAFAMTFAMAFAHAILLGLPLYLIFRARGWVNAATSVVAGFVIGAMPAAILSWSTPHPQVHATVLIAGWIGDLMPPAYFGIFGALGGAAFWLVLSSFDVNEKSAVTVRLLQSRRVRA